MAHLLHLFSLRIPFWLTLLVLCTPHWAASRQEPRIIRVATLQLVSPEDLTAELSEVTFVFLGEQHNNREHHSMQLEIIRSLRESGVKVGVALEMFHYDDGPDLDRWVSGTMGSLDFFNLYASRWDMEYWSLYSDIFYYAQQHRLPLAGINVPRELVRKVAQEGFASLAESEQRGLTDVDCDAGSKYLGLMGQALFGNAEKNEVFRRFCEAQIFWDSVMAVNLLKTAREKPGFVWVVLAGNFHAWKHGIPSRVSERSDAPLRIILPSNDKTFLTYDVLKSDADYVWWIEEQDGAP